MWDEVVSGNPVEKRDRRIYVLLRRMETAPPEGKAIVVVKDDALDRLVGPTGAPTIACPNGTKDLRNIALYFKVKRQ
jgi:hypothetical protein